MPYGWEGNRRFGVCSSLKPAQLPEQLTFLQGLSTNHGQHPTSTLVFFLSRDAMLARR